jgi:hypothetical protein
MNELRPALPRPPARPVSLTIERLVLDGLGFTPAQGALVRLALEQELLRLLSRPGGDAGWHGVAAPAVTAPRVPLAATPQPARLGREIAHSLYASLRSTR